MSDDQLPRRVNMFAFGIFCVSMGWALAFGVMTIADSHNRNEVKTPIPTEPAEPPAPKVAVAKIDGGPYRIEITDVFFDSYQYVILSYTVKGPKGYGELRCTLTDKKGEWLGSGHDNWLETPLRESMMITVPKDPTVLEGAKLTCYAQKGQRL